MSRLLGLFQLMDEDPHFLHLWNRLGSRGAIKDYLLSTFQLINELVNKEIYPEEWSIMSILANQIILKALQVRKSQTLSQCSTSKAQVSTFLKVYSLNRKIDICAFEVDQLETNSTTPK